MANPAFACAPIVDVALVDLHRASAASAADRSHWRSAKLWISTLCFADAEPAPNFRPNAPTRSTRTAARRQMIRRRGRRPAEAVAPAVGALRRSHRPSATACRSTRSAARRSADARSGPAWPPPVPRSRSRGMTLNHLQPTPHDERARQRRHVVTVCRCQQGLACATRGGLDVPSSEMNGRQVPQSLGR